MRAGEEGTEPEEDKVGDLSPVLSWLFCCTGMAVSFKGIAG